MSWRACLLLPVIALAASCTQATSSPRQTAAAPPPAAVSQPTATGATGERIWDVTQVTCGHLMGVEDDDREAALMFYYGYLAAQAAIKVIDVNKIDANLHRVMVECGKAPGLTVPQAFDVAFGRPPRS